MAHYGSTRNPPWAKPSNTGGQPQMVSLQQQGVVAPPQIQQQPTMYPLQQQVPAAGAPMSAHMQQQAQMQQSAMGAPPTVALPQPGVAHPTTLASQPQTNVTYPAAHGAQRGPPTQNPQNQRFLSGTVTKLHDNFGFVDEDIFFQTSVVKGMIPKVGDRVLVEATYNSNMPFKWNATRVQAIGNQPGQAAGPPGAYGGQQSQQQPQHVRPLMAQHAAPTPGFGRHNVSRTLEAGGPGVPRAPIGFVSAEKPAPAPKQMQQPPPQRPSGQRQPRVDLRDTIREPVLRDRSDRDRGRSPPRKRSRSPVRKRERERSPRRRPSPRPLKPRQPRYSVTVPKISLDNREANVVALRSRYNSMYVPSDFFNATNSWVEAFPAHRSFPLGKQCYIHVMNKEVDPIGPSEPSPDPSDADHRFCAKVMLMASPALEDLYRKSCGLAEETERDNFVHPARLLTFLVGIKGKSEVMAIGGPWSESCDGPNPESDPSVLIRTAIRTTRSLTGIDLSNCTQWYRFAEIHYVRPEEQRKGRHLPPRKETSVIFVPDIWSCLPSLTEWEDLREEYLQQFSDKMAAEQPAEEPVTQEEDEEMEEEDATPDPTHFSELDPKSMKVTDLRRELEARDLSSKGLKSQLIARLTKAIKGEMEKEEAEEKDKEAKAAEEAAQEEILQKEKEREEEEKKKKEEKKEDPEEAEKKQKDAEEKKKKEEKDRLLRERRYTLPDNPSIVVHPNPTAKGGKLDCTVMSLSVLLDYRQEDNKEHSFEVSLFAELFNEMLMRDFSFRIYRSLTDSLSKEQERKKKKEEEEQRKKEKEEKEKEAKKKEDNKKEEKKDKDEKKDKEDKDEGDKEDSKKRERKDKDSDEPASKKAKGDEKASKDEENAEDYEEEPGNGVEEEEDSKSVESSKDSKKEDSKDSKEEESKDAKKEDSKDSKKEDSKDSKDSKSKGKEDKDKEKKRADRRSKSKSEKDKDEKEKEKKITCDPALLLACVYFDLNHTGYIQDRDVEEILHVSGLHLSRAQISKLVKSVVSRDQWQYRKLTDVPASETAPAKPDYETHDVASLAHGNKSFLPGRSGIQLAPAAPSSAGSAGGDEDMVCYEGRMINIGSLVRRLASSNEARNTADYKAADLVKKLERAEAAVAEQEKQRAAREEEVKKLKGDLAVKTKQAATAVDAKAALVKAVEKAHDTAQTQAKQLQTALNVGKEEKEEKKDAKIKPEPATPQK